ncbi:MAG: TrmH family RNA methyltransferase [Beijerinckiaceae bacterium]
MATPIRIENPQDPRIEAYCDIQERDLVGRQGRFIVEGEVALSLMLKRSRFPLESVLMSDKRAVGSADLVARIPHEKPFYVVSDRTMEKIVGFHLHRGILAVGKTLAASSAGIIDQLPAKALVVVCVGIANHDNMGGIFRNAAAFGVDAVLLDETCCDPLYRKAIRVSVGSTLMVPFARGGTAEGLVAALQKAGFQSLALSPAGSTDIADIVPQQRTALFLGTEGEGLPQHLLCTMQTTRIPMAANFDSLNVATTSGIVLSHFFRK